MNNQQIRLSPNKAELVEIIADGISAALSTNLPITGTVELGTHFLAVGAAFSAIRIGKWGESIATYMHSQGAKKHNEAESEYHKFFETLRFLAREQPADDVLLDALMHLHILSLSKETNAAEVKEIYLILDTIKQLKGEEILMLLAAYRIGKGLYSKTEQDEFASGIDLSNLAGFNNARAWLNIIARACGFSTSDFAARQEEHLERLFLIHLRTQYQPGSRSGEYVYAGVFRLTESGAKLAEFIIRGQKIQI